MVALSGRDAARTVAEIIDGGGHERFAFLNAHGANVAQRDARFRDVLTRFTVLPDGMGVDIASRWLYGTPFPQNLNGTDFVPSTLADPTNSWRVVLWGASPGVAEDAATAWARAYPHHRFAVASHGYATNSERDAALARLELDPADLLLVAMGNPHQEVFVDGYIGPSHARVVMGVGALFDFAAGRVPRAPSFVRRLRSEWVFRLALEPARMWRRYVVGNPAFLLRVQMQRWSRRG